MEPVLAFTIPAVLPEAEARVREALQREGFGVLTEVDVSAVLRQKLGEVFMPYRILGVCNPQLAHRALQAEPAVGAFLPCGVALFEATPGTTTVALQNPALMEEAFANETLAAPARDALERLTRALAATGGTRAG